MMLIERSDETPRETSSGSTIHKNPDCVSKLFQTSATTSAPGFCDLDDERVSGAGDDAAFETGTTVW